MPPLPPMLLELPPQPLVRRTDLARRRGFDFNFGTMDLSVRTTGQTGSNTCWPSLEVPVFSDVAAAAGTRRSALAIALHYGTGPRAMGLKLSDRKQTPNKASAPSLVVSFIDMISQWL